MRPGSKLFFLQGKLSYTPVFRNGAAFMPPATSRAAAADHLVVGAGATGMAFLDVLVREKPGASVVVVDRRSEGPEGTGKTRRTRSRSVAPARCVLRRLRPCPRRRRNGPELRPSRAPGTSRRHAVARRHGPGAAPSGLQLRRCRSRPRAPRAPESGAGHGPTPSRWRTRWWTRATSQPAPRRSARQEYAVDAGVHHAPVNVLEDVERATCTRTSSSSGPGRPAWTRASARWTWAWRRRASGGSARTTPGSSTDRWRRTPTPSGAPRNARTGPGAPCARFGSTPWVRCAPSCTCCGCCRGLQHALVNQALAGAFEDADGATAAGNWPRREPHASSAWTQLPTRREVPLRHGVEGGAREAEVDPERGPAGAAWCASASVPF